MTGKQKAKLVPLGIAILTVAAMTLILRLNGRVWWCKLGDWAIYINEAWNSSHTSQHLFDPYTFTHVLHGVAFFWIISRLFEKATSGWAVLTAVVLESAWEIFENSRFIIEKYRANTASLDYFGDSVFNSVGDLLACVIGFWIAAKIGLWRSLIFFVLVEVILLLWIRDSLLLNILMLIYPLDGIKAWQMS